MIERIRRIIATIRARWRARFKTYKIHEPIVRQDDGYSFEGWHTTTLEHGGLALHSHTPPFGATRAHTHSRTPSHDISTEDRGDHYQVTVTPRTDRYKMEYRGHREAHDADCPIWTYNYCDCALALVGRGVRSFDLKPGAIRLSEIPGVGHRMTISEGKPDEVPNESLEAERPPQIKSHATIQPDFHTQKDIAWLKESRPQTYWGVWQQGNRDAIDGNQRMVQMAHAAGISEGTRTANEAWRNMEDRLTADLHRVGTALLEARQQLVGPDSCAGCGHAGHLSPDCPSDQWVADVMVRPAEPPPFLAKGCWMGPGVENRRDVHCSHSYCISRRVREPAISDRRVRQG